MKLSDYAKKAGVSYHASTEDKQDELMEDLIALYHFILFSSLWLKTFSTEN